MECRLYEVGVNNFGSRMVIVEYNNARDIKVKFDDGYVTKATYDKFKKGGIESPYERRSYNIGYLGVGKAKTTENCKATKVYTQWKNMLLRCYCEKYKSKNPTYKDCTVCEEWHNFQNFAKWYDENYYELKDERVELDKDFLFKDNKVYSPQTCMFIPKKLNSALANKFSTNTTGFAGVSWSKKDKKFRAKISKFGKRYELGGFDSAQEASKVYEEARKVYLTELIEGYKDKLPNNVYEKMCNKLLEVA